MCGIAGIIPFSSSRQFENCQRMVAAIRHRGPDANEVWNSECNSVALGHSRLAILDLSPRGRQPMRSASGRFTITYNGEVYNFREIRSALEKLNHTFQSDCDTEVILAAIEQWGLEHAVPKLDGMFAFCLWDQKQRKIHLIRDRVGIKPLYYGWYTGGFTFASELHAIRAIPGWYGEIDRDALTMYMRYGYVPAPRSIYQNTYKLAPASILTLEVDRISDRADFSPMPDATPFSPKRFWRVEDAYERGASSPFTGTMEEAVSASEDVLSKAIQARMVADVPLGAFLSGGIDSSSIVTLMQKSSARPVKTFTIGVEGHAYDESSDASRLAEFLGTEHHEHRLSVSKALEIVPKLTEYYDEPFADSSQIPTYLLSKVTRQDVTVALSGDGGDEVFGGYNRYIHAPKMIERLKWIPHLTRRGTAYALENGPWKMYAKLLKLFAPVLPEAINDRWLEITIPKLADLIAAKDHRDFYDRVTLLWPTDDLVLSGKRVESLLSLLDGQRSNGGSRQMRCLDLLGYHTDDILAKVDRASMAVSLEARVPFIDHRVIEFAATLPEEYLIQEGMGKMPLRRILDKHLPESFEFGKNKRGFSIPLADWLRGPLRNWAETLLEENRLQQQGYLNADLVRRIWSEHIDGTKEWSYRIWNVLMFQAFLERHHAH